MRLQSHYWATVNPLVFGNSIKTYFGICEQIWVAADLLPYLAETSLDIMS